MAGSYNHAVDHERTGKLLIPEQLVGMAAPNGGDAYETIEEMYGMIWWLATSLAEELGTGTREEAAEYVERARQGYQDGLAMSPGTDGELGPEDD